MGPGLRTTQHREAIVTSRLREVRTIQHALKHSSACPCAWAPNSRRY